MNAEPTYDIPVTMDKICAYRKNNPWTKPKDPTVSDVRFWDHVQCELYKAFLKKKKNKITPMKWIDWNHMTKTNDPTFDKIIAMCERKNIKNIMGMQQAWTDELIAQFYATLWFEPSPVENFHPIIHWSLQGHRFHISYDDFALLLGFDIRDKTKDKIITFGKLEDPMDFMYDTRYGDVQIGTYHGMKPYYHVLNNLFRATLSPKSGDASSILANTRALLFAMHESAPDFSVIDLLWHEIQYNACVPKQSMSFAPYIMLMIEHVTGISFLHNSEHPPYRVQTIPPVTTPTASPSRSLPPHPPSLDGVDLPQTSRAARPSRAAKRSGVKRPRSSLVFIGRALKAIFNNCTRNAIEIHEHRMEYRQDHQAQQEFNIRMASFANIQPPNHERAPLEPPAFEDPWGLYRDAENLAQDLAGNEDEDVDKVAQDDA